jgi:hypothetical protein
MGPRVPYDPHEASQPSQKPVEPLVIELIALAGGIDYALSCRCQVVGNAEFVGCVMHQPSSFLVDDNFSSGSVSSAVRFHWEGIVWEGIVPMRRHQRH